MPEIRNLPPQNLFAVTFGANDIARQRAFYEAWGWDALPYSNEQYAAFNLGGPIVAFFEKKLFVEEAAPGESVPGDGWNGASVAVNVGTREAVDTVWRAALDAGARKIAEPVDRPWGGRSGYVADPEGVRWEIAWVPPMDGGA